MSTVTIDDKITIFRNMLCSVRGPRLSCYDHRLRRIDDDDEQLKTEDSLLSLCCQGVNVQTVLTESAAPVLFTGRIGLVWVFFPILSETGLTQIYTLGPCLSEACSSLNLDTALINAGASLALRAQVGALLRSMPVLSFDRLQGFAAMLHYLLTGQSLPPQGIRLLNGGALPSRSRKLSPLNNRQSYAIEQDTMRRIQEGDTSLGSDVDLFSLGKAVLRTSPLGDQMRQMKNDVLTRLALLSRAAIRGGLSPETSYSLYERYAQSVEAAESDGMLVSLLQVMQEDFVNRVHMVKAHHMSREIEFTCHYIEQHLQEPLTIDSLASMNGYAEYYFSRKFKKETGMSPVAYMRTKRLKKAAVLLLTTEMDVKQIGASLQFCSHSFFSDCFRRAYGISPSQYRRNATPMLPITPVGK